MIYICPLTVEEASLDGIRNAGTGCYLSVATALNDLAIEEAIGGVTVVRNTLTEEVIVERGGVEAEAERVGGPSVHREGGKDLSVSVIGEVGAVRDSSLIAKKKTVVVFHLQTQEREPLGGPNQTALEKSPKQDL